MTDANRTNSHNSIRQITSRTFVEEAELPFQKCFNCIPFGELYKKGEMEFFETLQKKAGSAHHAGDEFRACQAFVEGGKATFIFALA